MKGKITYYSALQDDGRIISEDGQIYSFCAADAEDSLCTSDIKEETPVSFTPDDRCKTASFISKIALKDTSEDNLKFSVPKEILIFEGSVDDYELIDSSPYLFKKVCRTVELSKEQLISLCEQTGANALIDFKVKKILKNSIGFSYYLYEGQGRAAVIGKRADSGDYTKKELRAKLNHTLISSMEIEDRKRRIIGKLAKVFCGILLIIFIIGFAYS